MNKRSLLIAVLFLISLFACAKEVKTPSTDSVLAMEAFKAVEAVRLGYVKKDLRLIKEATTSNGYREMVKEIKTFESADLQFTPRWVEIKEGKVYINVSWSGKWAHKGGVAEEKGMAVFQLDGPPFKLARIIKGSPFLYPE